MTEASSQANELARTRDRFPAFPPGSLRGFERISVPLCNAINTSGWLKDTIALFGRWWTATWISLFARRRWQVAGLENATSIDSGHGVVLVSNHRSFFDMYVTSALLYKRKARFMDRLYFPVRSKFFYSNPIGLLVNLSISGCAMWPPVFRDDRKQELNPQSLEQAGWALERRGAVMGYHPEGTRGRGPDPYEFQPAKKGVGRMLRACHPDTRVLPFFIIGMGSDFKREVFVYSTQGHRGDPQRMIRIRFDPSVRVGDLLEGRTDQEVADHLMELVGGLAQADIEAYGRWEPS